MTADLVLSPPSTLADAIDALLPQTQCTRCGFADCRAYAEAIAWHKTPVNRCPPGGAEGIERLAAATGLPALPLDPAHGLQAPRFAAVIDEAWCIGCTLCIQACPVDCIVGAPQRMHTVVPEQCTGCELCLPACPVDCIRLVNVTGDRSGWDAWSAADAAQARQRHALRNDRLAREQRERERRHSDAGTRRPPTAPVAVTEKAVATSAPASDRKRAVVEAALARARAKAAPAGFTDTLPPR